MVIYEGHTTKVFMLYIKTEQKDIFKLGGIMREDISIERSDDEN